MTRRSGLQRVLAAAGLALPLVLSSLLAPSAAAAATTVGGPRITAVSTAARASVRTDGVRVTRFAFGVRTTDGTGLAASNLALSRAACRNCRSVAVSVQIVVAGHVPGLGAVPAPGQPPVVRVSNVAVAEDTPKGIRRRSAGAGGQAATCSGCSTLALAYQFVVIGRHRLLITPAAQTRLNRIQAEMRRVSLGRATNASMQSQLDALAEQISEVLRTGVVLGPHR